ncbi:hypothetical protein [Bacillus thuringiensis]|uniref:hypothetical protein n=1 Tax=Bacillus thuringiensis TaxID=1428 RepID=UPI000BFB5497|nr:hypothetical protein [Bacillus thuringiensis]PGT89790.1 hypothetical protein COD17_08550 [Bacillus thuringiensis]
MEHNTIYEKQLAMQELQEALQRNDRAKGVACAGYFILLGVSVLVSDVMKAWGIPAGVRYAIDIIPLFMFVLMITYIWLNGRKLKKQMKMLQNQ